MNKIACYTLFGGIVLCVFAAADVQSKSRDQDASDELSKSQLKAIQHSWISREVGYVATILLLFITLFCKELPQKRLKRVAEGLLLCTIISSLFFSVLLLCYIYDMMPPFLTLLPPSLWVWAVLILILYDSINDNEQEQNKEIPTNSLLEDHFSRAWRLLICDLYRYQISAERKPSTLGEYDSTSNPFLLVKYSEKSSIEANKLNCIVD